MRDVLLGKPKSTKDITQIMNRGTVHSPYNSSDIDWDKFTKASLLTIDYNMELYWCMHGERWKHIMNTKKTSL